MNEKLNYMVRNDRFYDLQFQLPFTFLKAPRDEDGSEQLIQINEKKVSYDK